MAEEITPEQTPQFDRHVIPWDLGGIQSGDCWATGCKKCGILPSAAAKLSICISDGLLCISTRGGVRGAGDLGVAISCKCATCSCDGAGITIVGTGSGCITHSATITAAHTALQSASDSSQHENAKSGGED